LYFEIKKKLKILKLLTFNLAAIFQSDIHKSWLVIFFLSFILDINLNQKASAAKALHHFKKASIVLKMALKNPRNHCKSLRFLIKASISLKTSSKTVVIFMKAYTFSENVFKKHENFQNASHYWNRFLISASISLKMSSKRIEIFEDPPN
jgi:hypothetical protein